MRRLPLIAIVLGLLLAPRVAWAQTGAINGTVTNAATGSPLAGVTVTLVSGGAVVGTYLTNASGVYAAGSLPTGTYFAYTVTSGFVDEYFSDLPCLGACGVQLASSSTPIVLFPGSVRSAPFALEPTGTITGRVQTTGGAPIAGVWVSALWRDVDGLKGFRQTVTSTDGTYTLPGLRPGTHVVVADAPGAYVDAVYGNVPCPGVCDLSDYELAIPITVASGVVTSGRDFTLAAAGRLIGSITAAVTGEPIPTVAVHVYVRTPSGQTRSVGSGTSDATGQFTVDGLASGTYLAFTNNNAGYVDEVVGGIPCIGNCPVASGADIPVVTGQATARNIVLTRGGRLSGTVRAALTGSPLSAIVDLYVRRGELLQQVRATSAGGASGGYLFTGLPSGDYFVALRQATTGYVPQVYPASPCYGMCEARDVDAFGEPVQVVAPSETASRDFNLNPGGNISGRVTAAGTTVPLQGVPVSALIQTASGPRSTTAYTNANGDFALSGLPAGTYRLFTSSALGHVNQVYPDVPCVVSCDLTEVLAQGAPVVLAAGATVAGRNFGLEAGARIRGTVTAGSARVGNAFVSVYTATAAGARWRTSVPTDALGAYTVPALPAGTYYLTVFAPRAWQLLSEAFDNLPCAGDVCTPLEAVAGTPISLAAASTSAGRHFDLGPRQQPPGPPTGVVAAAAGFEARFAWAPPTTGGVPTSYVIEAGLAPGTTVVSLPTAGTSLAVPGAPPGRYFVRVRALNAFGVSPPSAEVVLTITPTGLAPPPAPPTGLQVPMSGTRLIATWAPPVGPAQLDGYRVEAGRGPGRSDVAVAFVGGPSFLFEPVPPGFYFLRVRAFNVAGLGPASDEALVIAGGAAAPPGRPGLDLPVVTGSTVTLSWQPPSRGPVTSYIIEAGSAPGLANLVVHGTGSTATSMAFSGVPSGTYYVRVRAANAQGPGLASYDVVVTVP